MARAGSPGAAATDQARWQPWIDHVCAAVGVDPALVDVEAIHALTGRVSALYERPMAPVSAHLWGLARAASPALGPEAGSATIIEVASRRGRGGSA